MEGPAHEVLARPVPPAMPHGGPLGRVLVKPVVDPVELGQAVGVGQAARGRLQVEAQSPVVLGVPVDVDGHGASSIREG